MNPVSPIRSTGLPLRMGRRVTDHPKKWRAGLVEFQRMAEKMQVPKGEWFVAMGFPYFTDVWILAREGRNVGAARLQLYDMGWAALYKDMLGDIWVVRADRAHMHHETGVEIWEAVVFRWGTWLNDPDYENAPGDTWHEAGSASEWLDDKDTHSFDITGDVVEGVIPTLAWAESIILSPQELLLRAWKKPPKKNPRESGKWEYLKHGLHGGAGILFVHKNRMLLMRRSDQVRNPHQWGIPGGGAESRESPWATAVRETAEEAGGRAYRLAEKAGDVREYNGPTGFTTFVVFVKEEFKPKLNWEHDAWKWVTRRQADRMNLHKGVRKMLKEGI